MRKTQETCVISESRLYVFLWKWLVILRWLCTVTTESAHLDQRVSLGWPHDTSCKTRCSLSSPVSCRQVGGGTPKPFLISSCCRSASALLTVLHRNVSQLVNTFCWGTFRFFSFQSFPLTKRICTSRSHMYLPWAEGGPLTSTRMLVFFLKAPRTSGTMVNKQCYWVSLSHSWLLVGGSNVSLLT